MIQLRCPECDGDMIFNQKTRRYACQMCGLSLTKGEVENILDNMEYDEDPEEKKRKEREEYKNWYFSRKK